MILEPLTQEFLDERIKKSNYMEKDAKKNAFKSFGLALFFMLIVLSESNSQTPSRILIWVFKILSLANLGLCAGFIFFVRSWQKHAVSWIELGKQAGLKVPEK